MEAGFLNFHGEEHFSTLDSSYFLEPSPVDEGARYDEGDSYHDRHSYRDGNSYHERRSYSWDWDDERELNGDIGLIPVSANGIGDYCLVSTSPPSKEDFQKIMMEWQHLVNVETENVEELAIDVISSNAVEAAEPQDIEDDTLETKNIFSSNDMNLCDTSNLSSEKLSLIKTIKQEEEEEEDEDISTNPIDDATIGTDEHNVEYLYNAIDDDPIGHLANSDFDITKYVNEAERYCGNSERILPSGPGPGGKKLDLKNQRYVVDSYSDESDDDDDDDHIDVETVSETNVSLQRPEDDDLSSEDEEQVVKMIEPEKVLKIKQEVANLIVKKVTCVDINDPKTPIIENFVPKVEIKLEEGETFSENDLELPYGHVRVQSPHLEAGLNNMIMDLDMTNVDLDLDRKLDNILDIDIQRIDETNIELKTEDVVSPAIEAGDLNSLLEQFEASETTEEPPKRESDENESMTAKEDHHRKDSAKSKQILESLPEELIKRIKQSSKRKSISLIPPIPNKKRSKPVIQGAITANNNSCESVQMDHDYCISINSSKKDSGFSSCEEDDRSLLRNQPTVKTADGKLMVSLLKVNTLKKRKLNLEEYKQRRLGRSCSGSPARNEDENARRLQRMSIQPCPPPSLEMKTLVSIGVNTEQSWGRLHEIVRRCPVNFSPNSFITSLVEHLPRVKEINTSGVHGEDRTIVYLDKNRVRAKTANKHCQTIVHRRSSSSSSSSSSGSSHSRSRSPSPTSSSRAPRPNSEKMREVEERRVIYVGGIANSVTRDCLRKRFQRFGPINNVSVHFRRSADNFGFVTFKYKEDAYEAVEHGNEDPNFPRYDLSFGGRRIFCQTSYADLDNLRDDCAFPPPPSTAACREDSFEELLRETQAKLLRNKRMSTKS